MTLHQTARTMRQGLDLDRQWGRPQAWIMRNLGGGLQLALSYEDDRFRLALRREKLPPSEDEVAICSRAFDVPEGAWRHNYEQLENHAVTHRRIRYRVVELTWREASPLPVHEGRLAWR